MKLKIFNNGKIEQGFALFGKTGQIRFKVSFAESMEFIKNERWLVGINPDEETPIRNIYFFKPDEERKHMGWKMQFQNNSWFVSGKTVANELKLELPLKCKVEVQEDKDYGKGFKIVLPIDYSLLKIKQ